MLTYTHNGSMHSFTIHLHRNNSDPFVKNTIRFTSHLFEDLVEQIYNNSIITSSCVIIKNEIGDYVKISKTVQQDKLVLEKFYTSPITVNSIHKGYHKTFQLDTQEYTKELGYVFSFADCLKKM